MKGAVVVFTAMRLERIRTCFVISVMFLSGQSAIAIAAENQAGVGAADRFELARLDDALIPIDDGVAVDAGQLDVRDTATAAGSTPPPAALWAQLSVFDFQQRANARINLEPGGDMDMEDQEAARHVAALWNGRQHDAAIAQLRALEEAGATFGLGISWRVPRTRADQRALDYRIGDARDDAQTMNLDYHANTGSLFSVVRWGSTTGTSAWTMNMSTDAGVTWLETYSFSSSVGIIDVDCAVADNYVYVAYVAGNATDEARIRRCHADNGAVDGDFGFNVVFDAGENSVEEVALATNAPDMDNRIYYGIIQSNDTFRWAYDIATDGTTFVEHSPAISNAEYGLDMTWDNHRDSCGAFVYVSYSGNDGGVHVLGHDESAWTDWTVQGSAGSFRTTAVSASGNNIICAYEYPFSGGTGIRYAISYNCGDSWNNGTLAVPDGFSVFGYFEPDVDARDGDGLAIIYQAEAGEFDPMLYRTRAGFAPGSWSDPALFSDYDVYTGSDTAISYLPPVSDEAFSHGALFLSLDPAFRTLYFDRPFSAGASCGDTTPPVVNITSPATLACACGLTTITGTVDDPDGDYVHDYLQYRRRDSAAWVTADAQTEARSGVLYGWDTSGLAQDFYDVRIVGANECGDAATDSVFLYKPTGFDDLYINEPADGGVYGGDIPIVGTASTQSCFDEYNVRYRPAGGGTWIPVDPGHAVHTTPVVNDTLATWRSTDLGLADGSYELRVVGQNVCGHVGSVQQEVTIDNTPPIARFDELSNCDVFEPGAVINMYGQVVDANLDTWTLSVLGGPYDDWHLIAGPSASSATGLLCTWDTAGLPPCAYTLRLQASDLAVVDDGLGPHMSADYVSIVLGGLADADLNQDGSVDLFDYRLFQLEFVGPMP